MTAEKENKNEFVKQVKDVFHYANAAAEINLSGFTLRRFVGEVWIASVKRYYNVTDEDVHRMNEAVKAIGFYNDGITKQPPSLFETLQLVFREKEARHLVKDTHEDKEKIISNTALQADPERYEKLESDYPPEPLTKSIAHLQANGRQFNPLYLVSATLTTLATGMGILIDKALPSSEGLDPSWGAKAIKYALVSPVIAVSRTIESVGNLTSFMVESSVKWLTSTSGKANKEKQKVEDKETISSEAKPIINGSQKRIYGGLSVSSSQMADNLKARQNAASQVSSPSATISSKPMPAPPLTLAAEKDAVEQKDKHTSSPSC